jgi:hypothetical protein
MMGAEAGVHGTLEEPLIVLQSARDDAPEQSNVEELLRSLAADGDVDAKEAIAFLMGQRSQHSKR